MSTYLTKDDEYNKYLVQAIAEYIARQNRAKHPAGKFDKAGRWYPDESETCPCCANIRSPSRRWPYSLLRHCRSLRHVANLYGVKYSDAIAAYRGYR